MKFIVVAVLGLLGLANCANVPTPYATTSYPTNTNVVHTSVSGYGNNYGYDAYHSYCPTGYRLNWEGLCKDCDYQNGYNKYDGVNCVKCDYQTEHWDGNGCTCNWDYIRINNVCVLKSNVKYWKDDYEWRPKPKPNIKKNY